MDLLVTSPSAFHLLWLVAAIAALGLVRTLGASRALRRFADQSLLAQLAPARSMTRSLVRLGLMVGALALVVVALADIRWGVRTVEATRRGLDVVFALDVSRSMLAEDASPNRLERAKGLITDLIDRLPGDRVGLIAFAGDVSVACPLTLNHDAFRMSLDELDVRDATRGGSLLGDAIRRAALSFSDTAPEGKVIVVVSDGEDHGSLPAAAASEARTERGARVFTIGLGDERDGARIPVSESGTRRYLVNEGTEVWTKMDPRGLTEIAKAGDGAFIPVGTTTADCAAILQGLIVDSERKAVESTPVRQHIPRFQWFAAGALFLLLLECLVGVRVAGGAARRPAPSSSSSAVRSSHGSVALTSSAPRPVA